MDQIADTPTDTPLADTRSIRTVIALLLISIVGVILAWMLRQEWAKPELWPWVLFVGTIVAGAFVLQRLDNWLPGNPIAARIVNPSSIRRRILGTICIIAAMALVGAVVLHLWPDYNQWQGTPALWVTALILV